MAKKKQPRRNPMLTRQGVGKLIKKERHRQPALTRLVDRKRRKGEL